MINAMDNAVAFEKLTERLVSKSKDGMEYVCIAEIRNRVASVLAPWNYNFEIIGSPVILEVRNCSSVTVTGRLTIIDDDGKIVAVRQVAAGSDFAFLKEDKQRTAQDIKTYVSSACSEAYKKCWQELGVGAEQVMFRTRKSSSETSEAWYEVTFMSDFTVRGKVMYADVMLSDGSSRQLVIMKKGLDWMLAHSAPETTSEQMISAIISTYGITKRSKGMLVYGTLTVFNGTAQLLFEATKLRGNIENAG